MEKQSTKLLIADDNIDICNFLFDFFKNIEDIDVCAVTNNGIDTIKEIYNLKPHIVLLDVAMPKSDGIEVLRELKKFEEQFIPQIIMMSAIGQENILKEAFSLGASYYMVKPFKLSALEERIRLIYNRDKKDARQGNLIKGLEAKIVNTVMDVGIPTNVLGYKYIIDVLKVMLNSTKRFLLSSIYCTVADKNLTTVQCVESAIRNAIFQASKTNNVSYSSIFSSELLSGDKKPTNSQFLTKLSEYIKVNLF